MKRIDSRNRQSNKGFTLIEVLVAMLILSIIVVPFLGSFVTSARTNAKAKSVMRATTLAQNILEEMKASSIEDIVEKYGAEETFLDNDIHVRERDENQQLVGKAENTYNFVLKGIVQENAKFDVEILVRKPEDNEFVDKTDSSALANVGTVDIANIVSMNRSDCAYYAQDEGEHDYIAGIFENRQRAGSAYDADRFKSVMTRTITVDIQRDEGGYESVKVTYEYQIPAAYGSYLAAEDCSYVQYTTVYDAYGEDEPLRAVYLYYYPLYGSNRDKIIVHNPNNLDVDVNLIRMKDLTYNAHTDVDYRLVLDVKDLVTPGGYSSTKICTNLVNTNLKMSHNGNDASVNIPVTDLGNMETIQNLYDVVIRVYQHDAGAFVTESGVTTITLDSAKRIATITGTLRDKAD